jgi:hypothetical protein
MSVCHATLPSGRMHRRYRSRLKCYRFEIWTTLNHLGWIGAPQTQILKSLGKTQYSKKIKSCFFFVIMLDGSNFGKKCFRDALFVTFSEFENFMKKHFNFFVKKVKNLSKSVWVEARDLKFCMNMRC